MANNCEPLPIIPSSRPMDGRQPGSWRWDRCFSAQKPCEGCGTIIRPRFRNGVPEVEHRFKKQRFCSGSCAKKHENPMFKQENREKMASTLRRIGHKPVIQGGNGRSLTRPQLALLNALSTGWKAEHIVATGAYHRRGYAKHYKIDIAHPGLMIGIEVDGASHNGKRKLLDEKKDRLLAMFGWSIYRVTNSQALSLSTISESQDILRILREESWSITAIEAMPSSTSG